MLRKDLGLLVGLSSLLKFVGVSSFIPSLSGVVGAKLPM
jgi:hypothetical protein